MNKILNGDFSEGGAHWNNGAGGGRTFTIIAGDAFGTSDPDRATTVWTYKMCQQFSSNDEIIYAKITVWAAWEAYSDVADGYNRFIVELEKPNSSKVTLVDTTKTAVIGSGNILSASNIKTHMATYGNYKLWLTLVTKSAGGPLGDPPRIITQSQGNYDNISINIAVKKYKSVHEKMGGSEASSTHASHQYKSVAESVGLVEKYNVKISKTVAEIIGLSESYDTDVKHAQFKAVAEKIGLIEAYSIKKTLHRSAAETLGLSETLRAKRTQGNLETTYTIDQLTQWQEVSRVTTPWVKVTKVIP